MANSDKNIKITPNISQTAQPNVVFTGQGNIPITLKVLDDSFGTLSFEGSAGQLFSVNNNLSTGVIFSVNDISGIPQIDVNADGTIRLAPFGGTVYSNTLYSVTKTAAGAGNSVTIRAADGLTSGAGGSVILQPGVQATTGGNGSIQFKDTSGTTRSYIQDASFVLGSSGGTDGNISGLGTSSVSVTASSGYFRGLIALGSGGTSAYLSKEGGSGQNIIGVINWGNVDGSSFAYKSSSPTSFSTSQNDLALSSSAFQRLSSSAAYNLTGIAPPTNGAHVDGRVIWLHNVGSFNITLKHSQSSVAGNQFINENSGDIVLGPNRIVQCTYDSTSTKWRVHGEMYPYNMPTVDGTSGQLLSTNGTGTLSWASAGGSGTVTSVSGTGTVNGITLTGTVTSSGSLTLGGSLSGVNLASQVTGTLPIANGGTGATTALTANANIVDWGQLINHNAITDFNNVQRWGCAFVTGTTNGPGVNSASQYYTMMLALGADYNWGGTPYAMQMAIGRNVTTPYISIRYKEGGAATAGWGSWQKISAGYADTAGSATSATSATTATNATNVVVTSDSTNATRYLTFVGATSGNNGTLANSALTYNPSTGNVGIGTATTNNKLHIYAATGSVAMSLQSASAYAYFVNNGTDGILASNLGSTGQKIRYNLGAPDDAVYISSAGAMGLGQTSPGAKLHVETGAAGTKGLIVKAAATPTANILEVQNSSGTNLVYVDSTGDLAVGVPNATYFPSGPGAPLHVTRPTTAVATAIAAWPTYEPDTQTHARVTAFFTDGGNGGTATLATGTTTIIKFGEYYTARVVLMPEGAGGQTPADQNSGSGRDIMLLGGKSDNTAGKTGGRVFIQGGTGFAGAYGSNFGDVILQANGGRVCVGGTSPVSTSPGLDITADASNSATGQLMIKRASTNDRFRLTCGVHTSNYAFIKAYENSIGAINLALQPDVGSVGIGNTSPGAKLQIDTGAIGTKGQIIKGFSGQTANLTEWQNTGGTVLSSIDSSGNASFPTASTTLLSSNYTLRKSFARTLPNVVGDYVELTRFNNYGASTFRVHVVVGWGSGESGINKSYLFNNYLFNISGIVPPINQSTNPTHDCELEIFYESAGISVLRLRRSKGTTSAIASVLIEQFYSYGGGGSGSLSLDDRTGTGTSAIANSYSTDYRLSGRLQPTMTAVDPPGSSGNGTSVALSAGTGMGTGTGGNFTIAAGSGVTTGAGGSIILQPGAQATSGGNGSVRFVNPSNTGQYLTISVSSTQAVFGLTGITDAADNIQIPHNVSLPGKSLTSNAATIGSFFISGGTLRATNGTSTQFGSSNGTSTDNINYVWMRQDGHIAWYGDIGLRRDNVGTLTVTNASTGGGSLAFTNSSPSGYTVDQNNLVLTGSAFQRLSGTAARNITGIAPPSGSHVDGRMIRIYNVGSFNLTLKHNSGSSTAPNRMFCVQSVDIIIAPNDYAELIYDGTNNGSGAAGWRAA